MNTMHTLKHVTRISIYIQNGKPIFFCYYVKNTLLVILFKMHVLGRANSIVSKYYETHYIELTVALCPHFVSKLNHSTLSPNNTLLFATFTTVDRSVVR